MEEEKKERKISTKRINQLVSLGNKIGKILYILFIILLIYVITLIFGQWHILSFIGKIFAVISPLFIGWFVAWLLNPFVKRLIKRGIKRGLAVTIAYLTMLLIVGSIVGFIIPSLGEQISDIVSAVPKIANDVKGWIDNIFVKLSDMSLENLDTVKSSFLLKIESLSESIQKNLPETAVNVVSALVSGIGKIIISLILGFYLLYDFDKVSVGFISLFPKKSRKDINELLIKLNETLYSFVNGTLWLSLLLFIVSVIGFSVIGLNAPVLIAFICVITNLIPYIGPYLGAAVAGAIGFAESPLVGVLTLVFILITQTLEGEILHPIVMSKKMNLNPITIIISLLIFEYLFGIIGMVIATPVVAILKIIYKFLDEKFDLFNFLDKEEE
jgi:predicted PurR-regulated permease PerM